MWLHIQPRRSADTTRLYPDGSLLHIFSFFNSLSRHVAHKPKYLPTILLFAFFPGSHVSGFTMVVVEVVKEEEETAAAGWWRRRCVTVK